MRAIHAFDCSSCDYVIREGEDCYLIGTNLVCATCNTYSRACAAAGVPDVEWPALTPIVGGYCVRRLDDHRCVDVLRKFYSWHLVVTVRPDDKPHDGYEECEQVWCYYGHGTAADGTPRTRSTAFVVSVMAAAVWDGTGTPPGATNRADKRAGAER